MHLHGDASSLYVREVNSPGGCAAAVAAQPIAHCHATSPFTQDTVCGHVAVKNWCGAGGSKSRELPENSTCSVVRCRQVVLLQQLLEMLLLFLHAWPPAAARVPTPVCNAPSNQAVPSSNFDLILSSGFLCFSAHAGFAAALEERSLRPDAYVGTSSGALAAAMLAAGFSSEELAYQLSKQRPIALTRPAKPWRGVASTRKLEARMREVLPATFEELERPLALGVYRTCRGEKLPLLLTSGDLPSAVAASCAVPKVFSRVRIGLERYADGGAVDRTGVAAWRKWRPGKRALVNLVSDLPPPELGPRDGFTQEGSDDLTVVRTPRAHASFLSLGAFEEERTLAHAETLRQLDALVGHT